MKTTLNLNDSLYRRAKIKAYEEGRTVSELIEECLQIVLGQGSLLQEPLQRVPIPMIESGSVTSPSNHLTPQNGGDILLAQETGWARPE